MRGDDGRQQARLIVGSEKTDGQGRFRLAGIFPDTAFDLNVLIDGERMVKVAWSIRPGERGSRSWRIEVGEVGGVTRTCEPGAAQAKGEQDYLGRGRVSALGFAPRLAGFCLRFALKS